MKKYRKELRVQYDLLFLNLPSTTSSTETETRNYYERES